LQASVFDINWLIHDDERSNFVKFHQGTPHIFVKSVNQNGRETYEPTFIDRQIAKIGHENFTSYELSNAEEGKFHARLVINLIMHLSREGEEVDPN
jgi:hypothetical protein